MNRKKRSVTPFGPEPESKRSEKSRAMMARNDRWCWEWVLEAAKTAFVTIAVAIVLGLMAYVCLMCFGCETAPKEQVAWEEETIVRYERGSAERARGILFRTQLGNYGVSPGYIQWAETRDIELKAALAKLEQERLARLKEATK